ncbi:hypothetical protein Tco_0464371 [Tanacetum coccineum]
MSDRLQLDEALMGYPSFQTRFRGMDGSLMYLTPTDVRFEKKYSGMLSPTLEKVVRQVTKKKEGTAISTTEGRIHAMSGCCD